MSVSDDKIKKTKKGKSSVQKLLTGAESKSKGKTVIVKGKSITLS